MQLKSISQLSTINFDDFKELLSTEVSSITGELSSSGYLELAYYNKIKDTDAATNFESYKLPFTSFFGWMVKEISELYKYVDTSLCEISTKIVNDFSISCETISNLVDMRLGHYVFASVYDGFKNIHPDGEANQRIEHSKIFESTLTVHGETKLESTLQVDLTATFENGIKITNIGAEITGNVKLEGDLTCNTANTNMIYNLNDLTSNNIRTVNLSCDNVAELTARYALWG